MELFYAGRTDYGKIFTLIIIGYPQRKQERDEVGNMVRMEMRINCIVNFFEALRRFCNLFQGAGAAVKQQRFVRNINEITGRASPCGNNSSS